MIKEGNYLTACLFRKQTYTWQDFLHTVASGPDSSRAKSGPNPKRNLSSSELKHGLIRIESYLTRNESLTPSRRQISLARDKSHSPPRPRRHQQQP